MDKTLIVDIKKCLACKSCEIACALEHSKSKTLEGAIAESPRPQKMVNVEAAGEFAVPIQCRHCEDAPCIEICPTGAISRETNESPVRVDPELCIGCKLCILMCPLGILRIGRQGRVIIKCDMCYERAGEGKPPACVEACPTHGLELVSLEQLTSSRRRKASGRLAEESRKERSATKRAASGKGRP